MTFIEATKRIFLKHTLSIAQIKSVLLVHQREVTIKSY